MGHMQADVTTCLSHCFYSERFDQTKRGKCFSICADYVATHCPG